MNEHLSLVQDLRYPDDDAGGITPEDAERGLKAFMERAKVYANLSDIARILEVASKLGRLASGMATDKTEITGEDGGPLRVELSAALAKVYGQAIDVEAVPVTPALPEGKA